MEAARSAFVTGKLEGELVTAGDASTDALPSPTCTPPQNLGSKLAKKSHNSLLLVLEYYITIIVFPESYYVCRSLFIRQ